MSDKVFYITNIIFDFKVSMNTIKKKICIIIPTHWEARMGGAQYQAKILIHQLLKKHNCEIYYLARRIDLDFKPQGYQIVQIPSLKATRKYGFFFDTFGLLRILNQLNPDIIYQRVACAYTGVAAYYSKKSNCKMVWHVANDKDFYFIEKKKGRSYLPHKLLEVKFLKYGILNATNIVVQNKYQAEKLQLYFGRTPNALIRNFHPYPSETLNKGLPIKVVWVANFKDFKRPEVFIDLAEKFKSRKELQFIMVGAPTEDKKWQESLMQRIIKLDNLKYLGPLSQNEVNQLLAESHIFVNTSLYEGFANTFIQAWMREVPVVSLNVNPNNVFIENEIGFLSGNFDKMCQNINVLVENSELRSKMGVQARDYAYRMHSEKNLNELIYLLLDER
jgi:glycosyltransferase involved in cell wall biosynthesis